MHQVLVEMSAPEFGFQFRMESEPGEALPQLAGLRRVRQICSEKSIGAGFTSRLRSDPQPSARISLAAAMISGRLTRRACANVCPVAASVDRVGKLSMDILLVTPKLRGG